MDGTSLSKWFSTLYRRSYGRSRARQLHDGGTVESRFVEQLECRRLLAANLNITEIFLVDGRGVRITAPVFGERVAVRANFATTDLPADARYTIGFSVDGVSLDSAELTVGAGQATSTGGWIRSGWKASPGSHSVLVTIDNKGTVSEVNESDNVASLDFSPVQQSDFPYRMIVPIGGRSNIDWTTVNYLDVDPRSGSERDYRGGVFEYDGHDAWDLTVPTFGLMDRGITVMAAAPGTVIGVSDGNYDREISANQRTANFVQLDHGNGWTTNYWHLSTNTVTVKVGDTVTAGQVLGLVGSSGSSTDAHLHFNLEHHGYEVETAYAPADYHAVSPVYQGDQFPVVLAAGITNYNFTTEPREFRERPSAVDIFSTSGNDSIRFWYRLSHLNTGTTIRMRFLRPDGSVAATVNRTPASVERFGLWNYLIAPSDWRPFPGTWNAVVDIGGVELSRTPFQVVSGIAPPEVKIRRGTEPISDGRTTAVDFGTVAQNGTPPDVTLTLENHGGSTLTISGVQVPAGYSIVGAFPTSISVGGSASLTLRMLTTEVGRLFGEVRILNNDLDESIFNFNVGGIVTGTPAADAPTLTSTAPQAVVYSWTAPAIINSSLSVADPNSSSVSGSELIAELASGRQPLDVLSVRHQGLGAQQIGLSGTDVLYGGVIVGQISGGTNGTPLRIVFNSSASLTAITAVARNLNFHDGGGVGGVQRRVISVYFRDGQLLSSARQYTTVIYPDTVPPTDLALQNNTIAENSAVGSTVGSLSTVSADPGSPHFYQLVSGPGSDHNSQFSIVGNELRTAAAFNFEQTSSYSIRVRSTNPGGFFFEKSLTVNVTNVNEAPTNVSLSPASLSENGAIGATVGSLSASDPDAGDSNHTFRLVPGQADNSSFLVEGALLKAASSLNFEAKSSYAVLVEATDAGGMTFQKTMTVSVTNVNEPPTAIQLSSTAIAENLPSATTVGTLTSTDTDANNSHQWSLVSGSGDTDNSLYSIVGNLLKTSAPFDFESKPQHSIRLRTTDQGGLWIEQSFTINVQDTNDAPSGISLSNSVVAENQNSGTVVGSLTASDPDVGSSHTFSLVNGTGSAGNASFRIVGNQLQTVAPLDFESVSSYSIRVQALDQAGLSFQTTFVISVTDINEAPTGISFSDSLPFLREALSTVNGVKLATVAVVDDALGTNQLTLSGADASAMELRGSELWLKAGTSLNALTKPSFVVRVNADDSSLGGTPDTSAEFRINVTSDVPRIYAPAALTPEVRPVFRWTPVGGATSYEVWLNNKTTGASRYDSGTTSQTSFTPTRDLAIGTYNLWVRAASAAWSAVYSFRINTAVTTKAIPAFINAARPTLEWNALPGAAKYDLWLDNVSTGQTQYFRTQSLTIPSWTPTSDLPMGTYRLWVRGIDASNAFGAWSNVSQFSIAPAPTNLKPESSLFNRRPVFSWNAVTGAVRYHFILRNGATGQELQNLPSLNSTSWSPSADLATGPYQWTVTAVSAQGNRSFVSPTMNVWIGGRPELLGPSQSTSSRTPTFSWKPVFDAVRYELYVSLVNVQGGVINQTQLTQISFTPTTPLAVGQYRFWVRAVSASGEVSLWSDPGTFSIVSSDEPMKGVSDMVVATLLRSQLTDSEQTLPTKCRGDFVHVEHASMTTADDHQPAMSASPAGRQSETSADLPSRQSIPTPEAVSMLDKIMTELATGASVWQDSTFVAK